MRVSNPFRYQFRKPHPSTSCIFKMWFGKKYLIWKGKALHQSVNTVSVDLDRRLRLGCDEESVYKHAVAYIRKARIALFEVEVVFASDEPVELLRREYELLKEGSQDPDCLNTSFDPLLPKWITADHIEKYDNWKKLLTQKKTKLKKNATKNTKALSTRNSTPKKGSV